MRQIRFLQGWMPQQEAVANYLGRNQIGADNVVDYQARWQAAREAVGARTAYAAAVPELQQLPPSLSEIRETFVQRPDVLAAFQGLD